MNKVFDRPEMEVVTFEQDIIVTSFCFAVTVQNCKGYTTGSDCNTYCKNVCYSYEM